jgi:hypothetical protein
MSSTDPPQPTQASQLWQVYCVCIAEFDILKGNTLSFTYPPHVDINAEYEKNIGDLCLMDGSHIYKEDMTYLFLKMTPKQKQFFHIDESLTPTTTPTATSSADGMNNNSLALEEQRYIYGTVLFQNKRDETVKRGAIQKSLVLFSVQPIFSVWEPLLRVTLSYIMNHSPNEPIEALKTLYNALTSTELSQKLSVTLYNETFTIKKPKISSVDPFLYVGNVSLIALVKRFKRDVMILWYALMCGKRIMIVGTPAKQVANCCMSCPLLIHPCSGFAKYIYPYVPLTDLDTILGNQTFICGTTNHLFETRQDWWDVCASFTSNQVIVSKQFKQLSVLTARDKEFMMNILSGIEDGRGETWVRQQFSQMTQRFFTQFQSEKASKSDHMQTLIQTVLTRTEWYNKFQEYQKMPVEVGTAEKKSAVELVRKLRDSQQEQEILDRVRTVFELSKLLDEDVSQVDDLLSNDSSIVVVVTQWLKDDNSQFRKYSASIMASFASCMRGLLAISSYSIRHDSNENVRVTDAIVDLLIDDMPNVRSRGAYTIYKMSNLFIGCKVLLSIERNVVDILRKMILNTNDDTKTRTYATLSVAQMYHYIPDIVSSRLSPTWYYDAHDMVFTTTDGELLEALFSLLNVVLSYEVRNSSFRYSFMTLPVNERAVDMVAEIKKKYKVNEIYKKFLLEFTESPNFPLQLVMANAVYALSRHMAEWKTQGNEVIACTSTQFLTILSGNECCKSQILIYGIVEDIIIPALVGPTVSAFCLYVLHLLLSLLSRYEDIAEHFIQFGGITHLATFIINNFHNPLLSHFTLTAIECLGIALRSLSPIDRELLQQIYEDYDDFENEFDTVILNELYTDGNIAVKMHQDCYIQLTQLCLDKTLILVNNAASLVRSRSSSVKSFDDIGSDSDIIEIEDLGDISNGTELELISIDPISSSRMTQFFAEMNRCQVEDVLRNKLSAALNLSKGDSDLNMAI